MGMLEPFPSKVRFGFKITFLFMLTTYLLRERMSGGHDDLGNPAQRALWPPPPSTPEDRPDTLVGKEWVMQTHSSTR